MSFEWFFAFVAIPGLLAGASLFASLLWCTNREAKRFGLDILKVDPRIRSIIGRPGSWVETVKTKSRSDRSKHKLKFYVGMRGSHGKALFRVTIASIRGSSTFYLDKLEVETEDHGFRELVDPQAPHYVRFIEGRHRDLLPEGRRCWLCQALSVSFASMLFFSMGMMMLGLHLGS